MQMCNINKIKREWESIAVVVLGMCVCCLGVLEVRVNGNKTSKLQPKNNTNKRWKSGERSRMKKKHTLKLNPFNNKRIEI